MDQMRLKTALLFLLTCTISCGAAVPPPEPSGFLANYEQLTPSRTMEGSYSYLSTEKKLRHYTMVMLEPVQIYLQPDVDQSQFTQKQLNSLAIFFEQEIKKQLGESYPVVTEPGFGVFRLRVAITNIIPTRPALALLPGTPLTGFGLGGAAIEAEIIDTQSGERVAAFMGSETGRSYRERDSFTNTAHAEDKLQVWARLLRDKLDEAKGLHTSDMFRSTGNAFR